VKEVAGKVTGDSKLQTRGRSGRWQDSERDWRHQGYVAQQIIEQRKEKPRLDAGAPIGSMDEISSKSYRIVCSNAQSQETCNYDNYDHDADDVENVHWILRLRHARLQH
jgi:hypothetical protein